MLGQAQEEGYTFFEQVVNPVLAHQLPISDYCPNPVFP